MYRKLFRNVKLKSYSIFFILVLATTLLIILFLNFASNHDRLRYRQYGFGDFLGAIPEHLSTNVGFIRNQTRVETSAIHVRKIREETSTVLVNQTRQETSTVNEMVNVSQSTPKVTSEVNLSLSSSHNLTKGRGYVQNMRNVHATIKNETPGQSGPFLRGHFLQRRVVNKQGENNFIDKGGSPNKGRQIKHKARFYNKGLIKRPLGSFNNVMIEAKTTTATYHINASVPVRNESCVNCFINNYKILIQPKIKCKHKKEVDLIILISSSPHEFDARSAIRETWGSNCNHKNSSIKCVFVLGKSNNTHNNMTKTDGRNFLAQLKNESRIFKDVVQIDFRDSYGNLTLKTLSGMIWALNECSKAKYIMKTDTDMYVNTFLLPFLLKQAPKSKFMGGYCWGSGPPNRDPSSKWFVSYNSYYKKMFPPMCSGTGYLMSTDLASAVIDVSKNIPFFHLEDVYIGLCLRKLSVFPINLHGFTNMHPDFEGCHYKNQVMTSHYASPDQLRQYWGPISQCQLNEHLQNLYNPIRYPDLSN